MKINKPDLLSLKTLISDKTLNESKIKNKEIIKSLELNGAIAIIRKTAKRKVLHLLKEGNIFLFLRDNNYLLNSLHDIDTYIEEVLESEVSRDTIQKHRGDTKLDNSPSLKGLYISSLSDIEIKLDDSVVTISPQNGMGYFFFYTQKVVLNKDTIIVGVENYQVVWFAQRYADFFDINTLFVMINSFMLEWLEMQESEYIHFGDFDLAGINIYQNKIVPRLENSLKYSFFIPHNIEELIKIEGNRVLYEQQTRYKNMIIEDKRVKELQKIIIHYKKALEQEGLYELYP